MHTKEKKKNSKTPGFIIMITVDKANKKKGKRKNAKGGK